MTTILFWLIVGVLYALAYWRPGYACGYVLASYALEQCAQAFVPVASLNNSLCNYLTAGSVVVGLLSKLFSEGTGTIRLRAPTLAALALIAYCYVTILWSLFPAITREVLSASLPYLVVFVGLAPLLVTRALDLRHAMGAVLVCASIALAMLLLFAEWGSRGVVLPHWDQESNPLALSQSAGALLIIAALFPDLIGRTVRRRLPVLLCVSAVVLFVFLRSASRGQLISAVATTVLFLSFGRGRKWLPVVGLAVAVLFTSGFLDEEVGRHSTRWESEEVRGAIVDSRFSMASRLFDFWAASSPVHLLFGLGHATARDPRLLGSYPHVVPVEVLTEEGIVGALIYALALVVSAVFTVRAYRSSSRSDRPALVTAAALLSFEFMLTFKQGSLLGSSSFLLLLVLPGSLSLTASRHARSQGDQLQRA